MLIRGSPHRNPTPAMLTCTCACFCVIIYRRLGGVTRSAGHVRTSEGYPTDGNCIRMDYALCNPEEGT